MTALREGNIVLRAELFPRSTSSDLPHWSLSSLSPSAATPDHPRTLLCPLSFYLSAASFFAAFHEAQHLPVVTKKSSNHPRRSSGGLSFALLLLGWISPSPARVGREARRERQSRERIATEGGRKGERGARYSGCEANGAREREGELQKRRGRGRDRSEVRGRKTTRVGVEEYERDREDGGREGTRRV